MKQRFHTEGKINMKEKESGRKYRPFLVCYNEYRCVSSMTKEELLEQIEQGDVNWANYKGERLDINDIKSREETMKGGEK